MTYHLLLAALALALAASTLRLSLRGASQTVYAVAHATVPAGAGFSGAFGSGAAVRNLLF